MKVVRDWVGRGGFSAIMASPRFLGSKRSKKIGSKAKSGVLPPVKFAPGFTI
jgi:hypothetical protein